LGQRTLRSPSIPPSAEIVPTSTVQESRPEQSMYHCSRRSQDHRRHADREGAKVFIPYHCHTSLAATVTLIVLFCPTTGSFVYRSFLKQSWLMTPSSQPVSSKQRAMQAEPCLHMTASRCCHHHVSLLGLAHLQVKCGLHSSSCNRHLHKPMTASFR
jgi:hypothetical protein